MDEWQREAAEIAEDKFADLKRLFIEACDDPGNVATHAPRGGIQFEPRDPSPDDDALMFGDLGWSPEPLTVEFTVEDPSVFDLLVGASARPSTAVNGVFSLSIDQKVPMRRRWWEWLLRRPRRYMDQTIYIPRAKMADRTDQ